jgi:hypothetical protein
MHDESWPASPLRRLVVTRTAQEEEADETMDMARPLVARIVVPARLRRMEMIDDDDIKTLGLPAYLVTRLKRNTDIGRVSDLLLKDENDLLHIQTFGPVSLNIVLAALAKRGLKLGALRPSPVDFNQVAEFYKTIAGTKVRSRENSKSWQASWNARRRRHEEIVAALCLWPTGSIANREQVGFPEGPSVVLAMFSQRS